MSFRVKLLKFFTSQSDNNNNKNRYSIKRFKVDVTWFRELLFSEFERYLLTAEECRSTGIQGYCLVPLPQWLFFSVKLYLQQCQAVLSSLLLVIPVTATLELLLSPVFSPLTSHFIS